MYKILTVKDTVRVPPEKFGGRVEESVTETLQKDVEGKIVENIGVILTVESLDEIGEGSLEPGDPGAFYPVTYQALVFAPELHEITQGHVSKVTEFGVFVSLGPMDGLCHVSNVMDDYVSYDEKQNRLVGKDSQKTLQEGDKLIARVIAISLGKKKENKINLTMRQPGLGLVEWIKEEQEQQEEEQAEAAEAQD